MITLENVSKIFKRKKIEVEALHSINLDFNLGEFVVVTGPNGAGKTTLINLIWGKITPTNGEINFDNSLLKNNFIKFRNNLGLMPQNGIPEDFMSANDHFYYFGRLKSLNHEQANARSKEIASLLGFTDEDAKKMVGDLSGGMKRRVLLGVALINNASILLLDEPTVGLDIEARYNLLTILKKLKNGSKLIILITHHFNELDDLIDRFIIVNDGKIAYDFKNIKEIKRKYSEEKLESIYLKLLEEARNHGSIKQDD